MNILSRRRDRKDLRPYFRKPLTWRTTLIIGHFLLTFSAFTLEEKVWFWKRENGSNKLKNGNVSLEYFYQIVPLLG
jgi:hypothetical protein